MKDLCVRGIFRSGTNFLKATIELNYHARVKYDTFGWKHYFFPVINEGTKASYPSDPCIFIARNPYLALSSLFRYFSENKRNVDLVDTSNFSNFINSEITIKDGGSRTSPQLWFPNPVTLWTQLNYNALSAARALGSSASFIKYESLMDDPEGMIGQLMSKFDVSPKGTTFVIPENRMKNLGENNHKSENFFTSQQFDKSAISAETYMTNYSPKDLTFISSQIPRHIADDLGYEII